MFSNRTIMSIDFNCKYTSIIYQKESNSNKTTPFSGLPQPFLRKGYASTFPYISCNEKGQEATLSYLQAHPTTLALERRVHLGFSVWFNFDLVAVTQPYYMICCDKDDHAMTLYEGISSCICQSASRQEFVTNFKAFLLENAEVFFGDTEDFSAIFDLAGELTREGSWLSKDESFQVVKTLHHEGRALYLNLDITDETEFSRIAEWLKSRDLGLSTLYVSNIVEWLDSLPLKEAYSRNLHLVVESTTFCIQAYKMGGVGQPVQTLGMGEAGIKFPSPRKLATVHKKRPSADSASLVSHVSFKSAESPESPSKRRKIVDSALSKLELYSSEKIAPGRARKLDQG